LLRFLYTLHKVNYFRTLNMSTSILNERDKITTNDDHAVRLKYKIDSCTFSSVQFVRYKIRFNLNYNYENSVTDWRMIHENGPFDSKALSSAERHCLMDMLVFEPWISRLGSLSMKDLSHIIWHPHPMVIKMTGWSVAQQSVHNACYHLLLNR